MWALEVGSVAGIEKVISLVLKHNTVADSHVIVSGIGKRVSDEEICVLVEGYFNTGTTRYFMANGMTVRDCELHSEDIRCYTLFEESPLLSKPHCDLTIFTKYFLK